MEEKKRQKMCPNCDGHVDMDVNLCPFCGSYISAVVVDEKKICPKGDIKTLTPEETLSSLYPPPYRPKVKEPYPEEGESEKKVKEEKKEGIFFPTFIFSLGINIFLISLLLFFFATDRQVYMKWDARFWFVYLLISLPLMCFGYKKISKTT